MCLGPQHVLALAAAGGGWRSGNNGPTCSPLRCDASCIAASMPSVGSCPPWLRRRAMGDGGWTGPSGPSARRADLISRQLSYRLCVAARLGLKKCKAPNGNTAFVGRGSPISAMQLVQ